MAFRSPKQIISRLFALKSTTRIGSQTRRQVLLTARAMSSVTYNYETLKVTRPRDLVVQVELNRPEKRNAMNKVFWREIVECFDAISNDSDCQVVVLTGAGKIYTAGLDVGDFATDNPILDPNLDAGRKAFKIRQDLKSYQNSFNSIERCPKPVIAAIHNACIGGGIDMVTACDIRYCTQDAWFCVKEVDIGLAADVGTLQRLPKVVGNDSLIRELVYTARNMYADEAKSCGLVSRIFPDKTSMVDGALDVASLIATKSPIAVQSSKINIIYSRDHTVQDGLDFMISWNQGMLQSEDLMKAVMAAMEKKKPTFSKL